MVIIFILPSHFNKDATKKNNKKSACLCSYVGIAFVSGAGGLKFKSRPSQIEQSVANGSLKGTVLLMRNDAEMGQPTRYKLQRNERFDFNVWLILQ